jgi:hypothetical protein
MIIISFLFSVVAATPVKRVFNVHGYENYDRPFCIICGNAKHKQLRCLRNVAMQVSYESLLKQVLLVEIPGNLTLKLCLGCVRVLEKVSSS